ncbi:MAG: hypothetical protein AB1673_00710 [Actinomycetota bacterium]|jgi:hypothetical protein
MFKRLFWLTVGTAVGFGGSVWAQRRLRRTVERYYPERVAQQVSAGVRSLGDDVKAASREARAAMREREEALREQFRPPAR